MGNPYRLISPLLLLQGLPTVSRYAAFANLSIVRDSSHSRHGPLDELAGGQPIA